MAALLLVLAVVTGDLGVVAEEEEKEVVVFVVVLQVTLVEMGAATCFQGLWTMRR